MAKSSLFSSLFLSFSIVAIDDDELSAGGGLGKSPQTSLATRDHARLTFCRAENDGT
jgi:hypothetical protein